MKKFVKLARIMTREEQIKTAEKDYFNNTYFDGCDYIGEVAKTEAFIAGAKWADKTMSDKACKWLDDNFMNLMWGNTRSVYAGGNFATVDEMIENFRKAMEE